MKVWTAKSSNSWLVLDDAVIILDSGNEEVLCDEIYWFFRSNKVLVDYLALMVRCKMIDFMSYC